MKPFNDVARTPAAPDSQAVSRSEREALAAQRRTPATVRALTPPGMQAVKAAQDQQREERLRHLAERLDAAAGKAIGDFAMAKTKDVARDGFDRSR